MAGVRSPSVPRPIGTPRGTSCTPGTARRRLYERNECESPDGFTGRRLRRRSRVRWDGVDDHANARRIFGAGALREKALPRANDLVLPPRRRDARVRSGPGGNPGGRGSRVEGDVVRLKRWRAGRMVR